MTTGHQYKSYWRVGVLLPVSLLFMLLAGCFGPAGQTEPEATTAPPTAQEPTVETATEPPATTEADTEPAATPDEADTEQPPGPGGNLIMTLGAQDPATLDPALVGDTTSGFVVQQLFSGLVRFDNQLEIQPDLAESWEVSEDGRTYTFMLRPDARFADGTPITGEDIRYSLERATDPTLAPSLPAQTYLNDIEGVSEKLAGDASDISGLQVIDDRTIEITIDEPRSYFLSKLAHVTSYVVDQRRVEGGDDWTRSPNGSGPFEIERWDSNQLMVLRRNTNFYRDLAHLDRVTFLIGAAASNPLVLYEQDEIDVTGVPSFALARVQDENNPLSEELVVVPQLSLSYIGMNVTEPPFDDPAVRRAFTQMLDRQLISEVSLNGSAQAAHGILPPGMPGYNPAFADLTAPEADLQQAAELLQESSYGGPQGLPPIATYGGGWGATLSEVAREEFDIDIEVRDYEAFADFLDAIDEKEFQMFSFGWVADYPDPQNFLDVLFRTGSRENHMNYSNPQVDELLDQAAVETDEERRWELYREAEQLILEDAPVIPVTHGVSHMLVKPYVKGLEITPMGILDLSTVDLVRESPE